MEKYINASILIIEDDEEDFILLSEQFSEIASPEEIKITWADTYEKGMQFLMQNNYDLCLLDYYLGEKTGLDFIDEISKKIKSPPFILITGLGSKELDFKAMQAGVADYLVKDELYPNLLERTIRHTLSRTKMEEVLRTSEERLSLALNASNEGLWDWDLVKNHTYRSERWFEILGYDSEEVANVSGIWEEKIHTKDLERVRNSLNMHLKDESESFECEYRIKTKDGKWVWIFDSGKVVNRDKNGNPLRMVGIHIDISQRKVFEEKLRQFSYIIEQSPISLMVTDLDGNIEYVNKEFTNMTGFTSKEALGNNPRILKSGKHSKEFYEEFWKNLKTEKKIKIEMQNKRKDGTLFWEHSSISQLKDSENDTLKYICFKEDISEKKELQNQIIQLQKMEAIGNLAGGVAHDFNNLLTVIIGYSDILAMRYKEDDVFQRGIAEIKKTGLRATELTRHLLAMSRKQILKPKVLNLNYLINNMLKMLTRLIGEDIQIQFTFDEKLQNILADPTSIEQVILNLVINAKDAMQEGGGCIEIITENFYVSKNYVKKSAEAKIGKYIKITVNDSGEGIAEEVIKKIFDPFFTTKDKSKGTGLGLSVVYGIIKQQEGWITVNSKVNIGTTFQVFLPAIDEEITKVSDERTKHLNLKGNGEFILLVEDEAGILKLLKEVLENNNYKVVAAQKISEAREKFSEHKDNLKIIISDVVLPDGNGVDLVDDFVEEKNDLKVILNSGYTDSKSKMDLIHKKGYDFLQKPYNIDDLLQLLKQVL